MKSNNQNPYFERKKWKFEEKSQVCPNSLIFNNNLSEYAKVLILALNGIMSTTPNWQIRQVDIQKRLAWGKDRMQKAIRNAIDNGYIQTKMIRGENGRFEYKYFEYDTEPSFLSENQSKNDPELSQEKPAHTHCQPVLPFPVLDNPPLLTRYINISKENNKQPLDPDPQKTETHEPIENSVVVVSSDSEEEKKRKIALLKPYPFDHLTLDRLTEYPEDRIKTALNALEQRNATGGISNPLGFLRIAIEQGWKPNEIVNQNSINEKKIDHIRQKTELNIKIANKMIEPYLPKMENSTKKAYINGGLVYLVTENGCHPLDMAQQESLDILGYFLETHFL